MIEYALMLFRNAHFAFSMPKRLVERIVDILSGRRTFYWSAVAMLNAFTGKWNSNE